MTKLLTFAWYAFCFMFGALMPGFVIWKLYRPL